MFKLNPDIIYHQASSKVWDSMSEDFMKGKPLLLFILKKFKKTNKKSKKQENANLLIFN